MGQSKRRASPDLFIRSINHAIRQVESGHPGQVLRLIKQERDKLERLREEAFSTNSRKRRRTQLSNQIKTCEVRLRGYLMVNFNYKRGVDLRTPRPRDQFTI